MYHFLLIFILLIGFNFPISASITSPFKVHKNLVHEVKIFGHGLASLEERLRLIESAKKTIDIEYFIVKSDLSSQIFLQALLDKKKEGVRIRLLVDHTFSAPNFSPVMAAELIKKGIEVRYFNPISKWKIFKVQYRNHRKSLIIDNQVMMTGGRNIGDEYFDLKKRFKFLDRDIVIKGEIVKEIQKTFEETYRSDFSVDARDVLSKDNLKKKIQEEAQKEARKFLFTKIADETYSSIREFASRQYEQTKIEGTCQSVSFISEFPNLGKVNKRYNRQVKFDLMTRLSLASEEILIDSPYFINDKYFKKIFSSVLEKGVEVKLLTNSLNSTDVPIGAAAFDREASLWLEKGMQSYVYKGEKPANYQVMSAYSNEKSKYAVHAKTVIFDNKDTYIGSYNVDPRSASYNTESMIGCENSPEIAMKVKADIEERMKHALLIDSKESLKDARFYSVNFAKKMKYYFSVIPAILFKGWL